MKIYISGPISGHEDLNRPAFDNAKKRLEMIYGYDAVSPLDIPAYPHEGACPVPPTHPVGDDGAPPHGWMCYMRGDLIEMLQCEAIYMIEGWEKSHGARRELDVALTAGMPVFFQRAVNL